MNFFIKNLNDVITVINSFIDKKSDKKNPIINVKKVREFYNISSENRSKISFISRALQLFEKEGLLEIHDVSHSINYEIITNSKIDIKKFLPVNLTF